MIAAAAEPGTVNGLAAVILFILAWLIFTGGKK